MGSSHNHYIFVAAIAGAFGVRGELKLKCFTAAPKGAVSYGPLLDEFGKTVLTVLSSRVVKEGLVVKAKEVTVREQAEAMKSTKLYVPRTALPQTDEDEYYVDDLVGLSVRDVLGEAVGVIAAVHNFGSDDLIEVKPARGQTYFVPFTLAEVPRVSMEERFIVIDPMDTIEGDEAKDKTKENADD
ncbi:ribosome maturation factor RimM [Robiginitomaculum antarcticum]|uniref:ribosome maturation factor RimM n=1 Tax=Robiginitomaculum antarcticum TaxID=437507 RepID=UPI000362AAE0|nr:ribosome maturation factor RimM [Robiginitomaculum antarcticum]